MFKFGLSKFKRHFFGSLYVKTKKPYFMSTMGMDESKLGWLCLITLYKCIFVYLNTFVTESLLMNEPKWPKFRSGPI